MWTGSLDRRVVALASEVRPLGPPPFDPWCVAAQLGVKVVERQLSATLLGLRLPSGCVVLNDSAVFERKRTALAHEIGHHLVAIGRAPWVISRGEERFCDAFSWELLAPHDLVGRETCQTLEVTRSVVLTQLAVLGQLPAVSLHRSGVVICHRCGDQSREPTCICAGKRTQLPGSSVWSVSDSEVSSA